MLHFTVLSGPWFSQSASAKGGQLERITYNRKTFGTWWEDVFLTMFVAFADEGIDCDGNEYEKSELP